MASNAFRTYAHENKGRAVILFLLFLLAIYQLVNAGFNAFAIVCISPILVIVVILIFNSKSRMLSFWALIFINYFIQWFSKNQWLPGGIPTSLYNEMFEMLLIALAILDIKMSSRFQRTANPMLYCLLIWVGYCILQLFNNTCGLGMDAGAWYTGARLIGFSILYVFLVFSLYISDSKVLMKYLIFWGILALFSVFWVWKQQHIGLTPAENTWLQTRGRTTHILQGGSLIRYFSTYNDAANFGIGIASTAIAFIVFGITSKIKKHRIFFFVVGFGCAWATLPSGTRTATACLIAGFMAYIFLSKSFKIAVPFTIIFAVLAFLLIFTTIGNGNQQIRRMRTTFDKNDASAGARKYNQQIMAKYLKDAPFGLGIGLGYDNVPANNKYRKLATIPPDSEYVYIWVHTGVVGITIFLITTACMLIGACWIVLFRLKSPSLTGIGAGFCCAFISQQLGGYGNQVLLSFPNGLVFYGGLTIVYLLPILEKDWIEYEKEQLAIQEEKQRLKLEKKKQSRV